MDTRGPSSVSDHPSRRHVLALAGAGGAALAAGLLPQGVARAGHTPPGLDPNALHLGEDNIGTGDPTTLTDTVVEGDAATVLNVANGADFGAIVATSGAITGDPGFDPEHPPAVLAISANGTAIGAATLAAEEGPPAIEAHGGGVSPSIMGFGGIVGFGNTREEDLPDGVPLGSGEGVVGMSEQPDKAGVLGESVFLVNRGFEGAPPPLGIGVMGRTGTGTGVIGEAFANHPDPEFVDGTGVLGRSGEGTGVRGESASGTGVEAESATGQALNVIGTAQIEADIDPGVVLAVTNVATGDGAHGIVATTFGIDKPAVLGDGRGGGAGVVGSSSSGDGFGNGNGNGVVGSSGTGVGVRGEAGTGFGVLGEALNGTGVSGHSDTEIGVLASAPLAAAALHVAGRAVFETVGTGVVPAGSNQASVAVPFVGPKSQVIVTLTGNPGNRELRWVQTTATGFTVHLSPAPPNGRPATPFVYLVVDRAT